jgi:hypothetical protein
MLRKKKVSVVPRNEGGGILITEQEIIEAFKFLNKKGLGDKGQGGRVSLQSLTDRLSAVYPEFTKDDAKFILGDEPFLSTDLLTNVLLDNTITNFDPVAEAFALAFDHEGSGHIDKNRLKSMWTKLGFKDPLSDEDFALLVSAVGKHGKISLDDFRNRLLPVSLQRSPTRQELARPEEDDR